jgi:hypothetical protein
VRASDPAFQESSEIGRESYFYRCCDMYGNQGQAVGESVDDVHRGESGDQPTVLLITYAGTAGVPTSIPAKGEKAEY